MRVLGIDIGKKHDPSALVYVDGTPRRPDRDVLESSRLRLGMPYDDQARLFVDRAKGVDLVVADAGGVGEAVIDHMRPELNGTPLWALTITSGKHVKIDKEHHVASVPKMAMVTHLQAVLDHDSLRLHQAAHDLTEEFFAFERRRNGKMEARIGEYDDQLMALCLALMGFKIRELVG